MLLPARLYNPNTAIPETRVSKHWPPLVDLSANLTNQKIANSMARLITNRMKEVWEFMQEEMTKLQVK